MNGFVIMTIVSMAGGLVGLILGASLLVRGASKFASEMGVSKLVVGLTIVAFGTSAPELAASLNAGLTGHAGLAVGNAVGSNILNILLILGATAAISPLLVTSRLVKIDIPLIIAASVAVWLMALDGVLGFVDSGILTLAFAGYVLFQFYSGYKEKSDVDALDSQEDIPSLPGGRIGAVGACFFGLLLLVFGSRWLVSGSVAIASKLGLSEQVIGLTIVALGTSLPELMTSIAAALRKELDLAVGNVVGSNIFNLLAVLGGTGLASGTGLSVPRELLMLDIPMMTAAAVMLLPMSISGARISRTEGVFLLILCAGYFGIQGLQISGRPLPAVLEEMGRLGVLPGAGAVLLYSQLKSVRKLTSILKQFEDQIGETLASSVRTTRKLVIFLSGGSVLLIGVVMIVLPGPSVLVILLGLAILGTEFAWAKTVLVRLQAEIQKRIPKGLKWR